MQDRHQHLWKEVVEAGLEGRLQGTPCKVSPKPKWAPAWLLSVKVILQWAEMAIPLHACFPQLADPGCSLWLGPIRRSRWLDTADHLPHSWAVSRSVKGNWGGAYLRLPQYVCVFLSPAQSHTHLVEHCNYDLPRWQSTQTRLSDFFFMHTVVNHQEG